jgi:hypothetical protein
LKNCFAECFTLALGKEAFAEFFFGTRQKKLICREPFIGRSTKPSLPSVFYLALGNAFFVERPKKNVRQSLRRSAKKRILAVSYGRASAADLRHVCLYNHLTHEKIIGFLTTISKFIQQSYMLLPPLQIIFIPNCKPF